MTEKAPDNFSYTSRGFKYNAAITPTHIVYSETNGAGEPVEVFRRSERPDDARVFLKDGVVEVPGMPKGTKKPVKLIAQAPDSRVEIDFGGGMEPGGFSGLLFGMTMIYLEETGANGKAKINFEPPEAPELLKAARNLGYIFGSDIQAVMEKYNLLPQTAVVAK